MLPLFCRVFFSYCDSVASPQATVWAPAWASNNLCERKPATTHMPNILLLLWHSRVAAGCGLGTDLGATNMNLRKC
jgi:hypothetical protein